MKMKVYEESKNYTGTVVKLTTSFALIGLDNLVGVSVFGNLCLIPKDYSLDSLYVFFPSECQLSDEYVKGNNLYREATLNADTSKKSYIENNKRIKAIKFKGHKSTGIVMPVSSLINACITASAIGELKVGDEFNEIDGIEIVRKYVVPVKSGGSGTMKTGKLLDQLIDSKMFPEHTDTSHLLKYLDTLNLNDEIVISVKLHGSSERLGYTLVKRKLSFTERIAGWFGAKIQTEEYQYVTGSRRCVKSIAFNELKNKNHYYVIDLWSRVAKEHFANKLHKGEMIYFEVIGKDYNGGSIQKGYSYGETSPVPYIYRISHINPQGTEIDLTWDQMKQRAAELNVLTVPLIYKGLLVSFLYHHVGLQPGRLTIDNPANWREPLEEYLKKTYLDKPSVLDPSVVEEGFVWRIENYPRPIAYKLKSPLFLLTETKQHDDNQCSIEDQN